MRTTRYLLVAALLLGTLSLAGQAQAEGGVHFSFGTGVHFGGGHFGHGHFGRGDFGRGHFAHGHFKHKHFKHRHFRHRHFKHKHFKHRHFGRKHFGVHSHFRPHFRGGFSAPYPAYRHRTYRRVDPQPIVPPVRPPTVTRRGPASRDPGLAYDTSYCREYSRTAVVSGETVEIFGTACRQADGRWRIVN